MKPMGQGLFITLEGGEGAGKSTLARGLAEKLRTRGHEVVMTREPGGSAGADAIRALLLSGEAERWTAIEEALLFSAARSNHLNITIRPALARGAVVVCDRYYDSTRAYQIAAGGLDVSVLAALNLMIEAPPPDLTLILDLDPALGLARSQGVHANEDRFERKSPGFHARVREAFHDILREEPRRCALIDASKLPIDVLAAAIPIVEARL